MVTAGRIGDFALAPRFGRGQFPAMLPRHLVPLALGFAAFVMAEAASDIAHDEARPHAVTCTAGRIEIVSEPREDAACRFERFSNRSAAEQFARDRFGGAGAFCGCD